MSTVDGYLKIKTKLDNSGISDDVSELNDKLSDVKIDNQLKDLEKQLKIAEKNMQLKLSIRDEAQDALDKNTEKIQNLSDLLDDLEQKQEQFNSMQEKLADPKVSLTPEGIQVYQSLADDVSKINGVKAEIANATAEQNKLKSKVEETNIAYDKSVINTEKIKGKIEETNIKQQVNDAKQLEDTSENIEDNVNGATQSSKSFGDSIESAIKRVARLALGIFSIRSAYNLVRQASSTLAQYDKEYANNLEYIRYILAQTLAPVIQWIMNMLQTVLGYVNYLAKAWFNVTIFSSKTARNFANASKSTSQMKKNLQSSSFDEMNVLSDNNSSSNSIPTFRPENVQIPSWLQKFAELGKPVIDFFNNIIEKYGPVKGGILIVVGALAGFMILKSLIKLFTSFGKAFAGFGVDFTGFFDSLGKSVEIIAIFGGISLVLGQVIDLMEAFSESGISITDVAKLLITVFGTLAGTFILLAGAMQLLTPSWQSIAGAVVIFGGLAIVLATVTNLIDTFSKSGMTLSDVIGLMSTILVSIVALMGAVVLLGPTMTAGLIPFSVVIVGICALLITMAETLPKILDASSKFIQSIAPVVIVLIRTINECIDNTISILGTVLPPIINSIGSLFNSIFNGISNVVTSVGNTVSRIVDSMGYAVVSIIKSIQGVIQQVGNTITQVATTIIWFINSLGPAINNFVNNAIVAVTKLVNFVVSAVEYLVNRVVDGINGLAGVLNNLPGINIRTKGYVSIPRFRPRLASGGIVDMPGKGVDIGGAIAGEAGREGVLPLTNPQAMEELGREIGKWINVNNVLNNYMDGRLIQRSMNKRNQELAFAMNGR